MTLHIINKSAQESSNIIDCLQLAIADHKVLLIESGVYNAINNTNNEKLFAPYSDKFHFYILEEDLAARGISGKILPGFTTINYSQFVELSLEVEKVQSWG